MSCAAEGAAAPPLSGWRGACCVVQQYSSVLPGWLPLTGRHLAGSGVLSGRHWGVRRVHRLHNQAMVSVPPCLVIDLLPCGVQSPCHQVLEVAIGFVYPLSLSKMTVAHSS